MVLKHLRDARQSVCAVAGVEKNIVNTTTHAEITTDRFYANLVELEAWVVARNNLSHVVHEIIGPRETKLKVTAVATKLCESLPPPHSKHWLVASAQGARPIEKQRPRICKVDALWAFPESVINNRPTTGRKASQEGSPEPTQASFLHMHGYAQDGIHGNPLSLRGAKEALTSQRLFWRARASMVALVFKAP